MGTSGRWSYLKYYWQNMSRICCQCRKIILVCKNAGCSKGRECQVKSELQEFANVSLITIALAMSRTECPVYTVL
jgi:hypothetical protein